MSLVSAAGHGDVAAIERMLRSSVVNGGLWFPDARCVEQFPVAAELHPAQFHAFATCLAGLKLEASTRKDPLPDVTVLTYAPGIEIEARIFEDAEGPRLSWIGYEARRDVPDGLPSISPETLETLRSDGERNGPLAPELASGLELDRVPEHIAFAWVKVCIDASGAVTGVHAREATSLRAAHVFTAAASTWKFRPFVPNGQAIPVCSMLPMVYPPDKEERLKLLPVPLGTSTDEPILVSMALSRISGEKFIHPDDTTRTQIARAGITKLVGSFKLCIDEQGRVATAETIRSTGVPPYDARLHSQILKWIYQPVLDDGKPVRVCTGVTFIYSQTTSKRAKSSGDFFRLSHD